VEQLGTFIEALPEATLAVDPSGRIAFANAGARALFGAPGASLVGQTLGEVVRAAVAGEPGGGTRLAAALAGSGDASGFRGQAEVIGRDGLPLEIDLRVAPVETPDGPWRLVTATPAGSGPFRQLVEDQPDLICRFLPDTTLTYVNRAYARFFGSRPEDLVGRRFVEFLGPEEAAAVVTHLAACTPAAPSRRYEHETRGADGEWRWHLWNDRALFDGRGRPVEFQSVGVDVTERRRAEALLRAREERLTQALEAARAGAWEWQVSSGRAIWSEGNYRLLGLEPGSVEACYRSWIERVHAEDRAAVERRVAEAVATRSDLNIEFRVIWPDGSVRWINDVGRMVFDGAGDPTGMYGIQVDVTERRLAQLALDEEQRRAQVTLDAIADAVITTDGQGRIEHLNPVAERLTGWSTREALGKALAEVFRVLDEARGEPAADVVRQCLERPDEPARTGACLLVTRDGEAHDVEASASPIRGPTGRAVGAVLVFHDVTETRQVARQMEYDASHDPLTGLCNRRELERRLEQALGSARAYGHHHALCYLDLDQFKLVNDSAGHAAGDALLKEIRQLLSGIFRERDTLARLGGDEFGLLLDNCPIDRAMGVAQLVVAAIRDHRFVWQGQTFQVGVSIGLVPITADSESSARLMSDADVACYSAKDLGGNRVHVYQHEGSEPAQRHGELLRAARLRDALEQDRLRLYVQPVVALAPDRRGPVHHEVLLRLVDEGGQLVLPSRFIPAAERYGVMPAVDRWVVRAALARLGEDPDALAGGVSLNLSGNSLSDDTLLGFLRAQLEEHGVPPERVCFEVTETAAIRSLDRASAILAEIRALGCKVALDDFGSGLSSFRYLKALPVDYLKIDGSFVEHIDRSERDQAMVAAINQLAQALGIETIAEHASSDAIVGGLRALGVDYGQGFALGRPEPWAVVAPQRSRKAARGGAR
jgi:diguanylate cyclase (GGDEF)-like protein/PAS domain S-box-containing protein